MLKNFGVYHETFDETIKTVMVDIVPLRKKRRKKDAMLPNEPHSSWIRYGEPDFLQMALRELGIKYEIRTYQDEVVGVDLGSIYLNIRDKVVECERYEMRTVNAIKREYSRQVLTEVAKRKRWVIQKETNRKLKMRRY